MSAEVVPVQSNPGLTELSGLLADHSLFHTRFQLDHMVTIRAGVTPYGCYVQALRELDGRYKALRDLYLRGEQLTEELELAKKECTPTQSEVLRKIQVVQIKCQLEDLEFTMAHVQREFLQFLKQARVLKAHLGDLTPARKEQLEAEFWQESLKRRIEREGSQSSKITPDTKELVDSFPIEMQKALLQPLGISPNYPPKVLTDLTTINAGEPATFDFEEIRGDVHKMLCSE